MNQENSLLKNQAFIDGNWCDAKTGNSFVVENPATGEAIARCALAGETEAERAIQAADKALNGWQQLTAKERSVYLYRLHELLLEHQEDLAQILTAEQGKPLPEARAEIQYGASYFKWFAEESTRIYGDVIPASSPDKRVICIKQAVGVVACITPWNFPNAMLARKIAPALAAGCTVICKPANETPFSALAFGELANRAGIPAGVINIVCGDTEAIGEALTSSQLVRKLTFTGSTSVGKTLAAACAKTMKRTSMELGGNAPFIVFDDADIDSAVQALVQNKFRNAGQTCICANRILVQNSIIDLFADKLSQAIQTLNVGNGLSETVSIGPLIHREAAQNVQAIVDDAINLGATPLIQATKSLVAPPFIKPIILKHVSNQMRAFKEEIFGPVAPLIRFDTEEEAIRMANDTRAGLAAYLFTKDYSRSWRVAEALEYGMVGVNDSAISNEMAPFGGIKESGQGREGSKYGLDDYLEIKYMSFGDTTAG